MPNKLAALVRAKYPGSYDSVDDRTLADAFKRKYPGSYDHLDVDDDVPEGSGWVPPAPSYPDGRVKPVAPAPPEETFGQRLKQSAYDASPLPLFEPEQLPSTLATVAGTALAATGVGAIPVIAASAGMAGGTTYARDKLYNLVPGGKEVESPALNAAKAAAWEGALGVGTLGVARGLQTAGKAMYRNSLRAPNATREQLDKLAETGIDEGISVSRGGREKARHLIDSLNAKVRATIEGLEGRTIDRNVGIRNMKTLRAQMQQGAAPASDLNALDNLIADYETRFGGQASVLAGHDQKVAIHNRLAQAYDQTAPAVAVKQGQMEYARGLRSEIEAAGKRAAAGGQVGTDAAEIGATNARVGKLHELEELIATSNLNRVTPGDVASASFLPVEFIGARALWRSPAQSGLGRRMVKVGRALDPYTYGKAAGINEVVKEDTPFTVLNRELSPEEAADNYVRQFGGYRDPNPDDSWVRLATDGSDRLTKRPPSMAGYNEPPSPEFPKGRFIPEEDPMDVLRRGQDDGNYLDIAREPGRESFDRSLLSLPEERVTYTVKDGEDMYLEQWQAENARRARLAEEARGRNAVQLDHANAAEERNRLPQQMLLNEPEPDPRQLVLRDLDIPNAPVRVDPLPDQIPELSPRDLFLRRDVNRYAPETPGAAPMPGNPGNEFHGVNRRVPRDMEPKVAAPPEPTVFIVQAGKPPVPVPAGGASGVTLGPGQRFAMRIEPGNPRLKLVGPQDVVGLSDGTEDAAAREFYAFRDWGQLPTDEGFAYHATSAENLEGIRAAGTLKVHRPWHGTPEQNVWPDGGGERRAYFAPSPRVASSFAPAEGQPVLLRGPRGGLQTERGTGDLFSRKPIKARELQYVDATGQWRQLAEQRSIEVLDDVGGVNASGESAASLEALSRQAGMKAQGQQFAVRLRDGRLRPLIGPDAVDYRPQPGETFGIIEPGPDGRPRFTPR